MNPSFQCPNCKSTNLYFNIVHPESQIAQIDPASGDIIHQFAEDGSDSFPSPYEGPDYHVQCPECGFMEDEKLFLK